MRRGGGTGAGIVPSAPGIVRARPGGLVCAPPLRAPCVPRARARLLLAADAPHRAAAPQRVAEIPDQSPWDEEESRYSSGPQVGSLNRRRAAAAAVEGFSFRRRLSLG